MNYIPLNLKTNYSLLKSLIDIEKLIKKCKELKYDAVAITDENMFGVMEFYKMCLDNNIKPIIGLSIIIDDFEVLLYAKNYNGATYEIFLNIKNPYKINDSTRIKLLNEEEQYAYRK